METLPKNLIARKHLSRCPDANGDSECLLFQSSVRTEDGTGSTRVELESEDGLVWSMRQHGDGWEGNVGEIREMMSQSDYE